MFRRTHTLSHVEHIEFECTSSKVWGYGVVFGCNNQISVLLTFCHFIFTREAMKILLPSILSSLNSRVTFCSCETYLLLRIGL